MPATHALASKRSQSLFWFHLFFFTFLPSFLSSFLFSPVGMRNERIARVEKNEVAHWLWKRWEEC